MLDKLCRDSSHLEKLLTKKLKQEQDMKILEWAEQENHGMIEEWRKTVTWMRQVCNQSGFQCDSFALAVHILDAFLGLMKIHGKYLKCAAMSVCFMASKFSEEEQSTHTLANFLEINCSKFTPSDIVRMERIILQKIEWDLVKPTASTFLEMYFNLLCANHFETVFGSDALAYSIYRSLASHLELCYCEPSLQTFRGSITAIALISCTMEKITSRWFLYINKLAELSEISIKDLLECRELIKSKIFGYAKPSKPKLSRPRKFARRRSLLGAACPPRTTLSPIVENPFESEFFKQQQQQYRTRSLSLESSDGASSAGACDSSSLEDIDEDVMATSGGESTLAEELKRLRRINIFDEMSSSCTQASPAKRRKLTSCGLESHKDHTAPMQLTSPGQPCRAV